MKQQENDFKFNSIEHIGFFNKIINELNLEYWINLVYQYQKENPISVLKSNAGGWQSKDNLNHFPPFLPLVRLLQNNIDLIEPYKNNVISSLWVNISPPLSYNRFHNHSINDDNSLSGVLYLKTPLKSGDINFYPSLDTNHPYSYSPTPKELLIFRQKLIHSVSPNFSQDDRISIAFNLF